MGLWRYKVESKPGYDDPVARQVTSTLIDFGLRSVHCTKTSRLFLLESECLSDDQVRRIGAELLCDPVCELWSVQTLTDPIVETCDAQAVEVHLKPGVMDPVAQSSRLALTDMGIETSRVRTARRYEFSPVPSADDRAVLARLLGNSCIEEIVMGSRPLAPVAPPPERPFQRREITLRDMSDAQLQALSERGHLFLNLDEMRAIQLHFKSIGRDPTDLELETFAQTWSEHCVHKTVRSAIEYRGMPMPGDPQQRTERIYRNLLKDTIVRGTEELQHEGRGPPCLSVFKDNAGIIAFDESYGIAVKVETHNHPSAIEPYGGASTGVGGVIRDVLGCGLGAKPIANTDVFCIAPPDWPIDAVPRGVIHPRVVLKGVVAGVRDYGNRMGIPTVNGAVHFDPRYLGNPLVYCGCIGLIPRDRIEKSASPGDLIVLLGGRTGRDGIHGATFSSAELTETHEAEFSHAVQIGNAIEEKKVLDVLLQARDFVGSDGIRKCLYSCVTDCGAGGLSSAVGEMAASIGAEVDLETVPLKYAGLRYDEIWISEAQERMVLAVPRAHIELFLKLAAGEDVEATVIGQFNDSMRLTVRYNGTVVGDIDLIFLNDGLPRTTRHATWQSPTQTSAPLLLPASSPTAVLNPRDWSDQLKKQLSAPTTASKHWIIRQYDHEVGGRSVVKPLVGRHDGPSDAAVLRPRLDSNKALAVGCGLAPAGAERDPYWTAVASIDEALRNVVCVGGDPHRTAILDNFCWPRVDHERNLGALVRACQACYDMSKAYGLPFISGKDSLNNEFALHAADTTTLRRVFQDCGIADLPGLLESGRLAIPYTLLITAVALIDDAELCVTSVLKDQPSVGVYYAGANTTDWNHELFSPLAKLHMEVGRLIRSGHVLAAHDISDGGLAVAVAEMAIGAGAGAAFFAAKNGLLADPFALPVSGYLLQLTDESCLDPLRNMPGVTVYRIAEARFGGASPRFEFVAPSLGDHSVPTASMNEIADAWRRPLDW